MTTILFIVGLLTSLGSGLTFLSNDGLTGRQDAALIVTGTIGVATMALAILLANGWQP